jgi:hypothetical protein
MLDIFSFKNIVPPSFYLYGIVPGRLHVSNLRAECCLVKSLVGQYCVYLVVQLFESYEQKQSICLHLIDLYFKQLIYE